ncbi:MAG: hypothetical protein B6U72_02160 [Candidatus Altiarchaeales archaeon ex4484_2]|nr:MAG: hypothetical protein B6U72_02160 [Candidatus Altiarchaeales archaeon ex4484_2]
MPAAEIPYLKSEKIRAISKLFIGVGAVLSKVFSGIDLDLKKSGVLEHYAINAREYLSVCAFLSTALFFSVSGIMSLVFMTLEIEFDVLGEMSTYISGGIVGFAFAFFLFFQMMYYPRSIINKRVANIDRNLLFVLRTILVQIRSGIPIFDSFVTIASGDYGEISKEFANVIEKVRTGKPVTDSLEELAIRNPSNYFRRALWQLVNSIKSGSDVADNLAVVIKALSKEQLIEIRKYQSTLNPLSMMYMMVAVIAPSLGITVMIVLSTFPGMDSIGTESSFWGLLALVIFMQVMFMFMIKTRRPNLMGE